MRGDPKAGEASQRAADAASTSRRAALRSTATDGASVGKTPLDACRAASD